MPLAERDIHMYHSQLHSEVRPLCCKAVLEKSREYLLKCHQSTLITGDKTEGNQRTQKFCVTTTQHQPKYFCEHFILAQKGEQERYHIVYINSESICVLCITFLSTEAKELHFLPYNAL